MEEEGKKNVTLVFFSFLLARKYYMESLRSEHLMGDVQGKYSEADRQLPRDNNIACLATCLRAGCVSLIPRVEACATQLLIVGNTFSIVCSLYSVCSPQKTLILSIPC